jgi:WD40 repeat protein
MDTTLRDDAAAALRHHRDAVVATDTVVFATSAGGEGLAGLRAESAPESAPESADNAAKFALLAATGGCDDCAWLSVLFLEGKDAEKDDSEDGKEDLDVAFAAKLTGASDTVSCLAFRPVSQAAEKGATARNASDLPPPDLLAAGCFDACVRLYRLDEAAVLFEAERALARGEEQGDAQEEDSVMGEAGAEDGKAENEDGDAAPSAAGEDEEVLLDGDDAASDEEVVEFTVSAGKGEAEDAAAVSAEEPVRTLVELEPALTLDGPAEGIEWLSWHPSGQVLLAGCTDNSVWMWKIPSGEFMQLFAGHAAVVSCGGFTIANGGKKIVSGSDDGSVRVWDPRSGSATVSFEAVKTAQWDLDGVPVTCITFHPSDEAVILVGFADGSLRVCNINSGKVLQVCLSPSEIMLSRFFKNFIFAN